MRIFKSHPLAGLINSYLIDSPQPSSMSYAWNGGSLLGLCLVTQLATGIFLAMHYIGSADLAFISVEGIMRDVWGGAMIRYIHANTASLFFVVIYMHIARGLWYGSYRAPRTMTWNIGVVILILLIATAFMGYLHSPKWIFNNQNIYSFCFSIPFLLSKNEPNKPNETPKIVSKFILDQHLHPVHVYNNLEDPFTRAQILKECKPISGVYLILNKITLDYYVGSASTGKFYSRFLNHLFYFNGSKIVKRAVQKYKIKNFAFLILETMPTKTTRENNKQLLDLEDLYLKTLLPNYNILTEAGNSYGYKHTEITRLKMVENYSEERRERIRKLNLGTSLAPSTKALLREAALARVGRVFSPEVLLTMQKNSKPIIVRHLNGLIYGEFPSITSTADHLKCGIKTIYRALRKEKPVVKRIWIVEFKNK